MALKFGMMCAVLAMIVSGAASAQELPRGEIVRDVPCQRNASQSYALYLPSYFNPSRPWPVILTFDGSGRGREGVERYRAAAEKYGYVVAGSNNSRNGPWNVGLDAAAAMTADIKGRFPVDPRRMYTAGMSGGARVAIMVAQNSSAIAGVLASSAGYSTAFHTSERFPFFGSAGTEDFNYREMQVVDRLMTSPHRVEIFEGGHTWLPVEMATSGVEWMEIQAMKNGLRPRDETLVAELFSKRMASANAQPDNLSRMRELKQVAADFETLRDVAPIIESAAALERGLDVAGALSAEQADAARELRVKSEVDSLVRQLSWPERADAALVSLKSFVASLLDIARQPTDSSERRIARRVLAGLRASRGGVRNQNFQAWIAEVQIPAPPQRTSLMHNMRHAIRGLRKSPGFTVVAVLTLALGIGGATAIFSVADAVVLRPLPYGDPDRLVAISMSDRDRNQPFVEFSYPAYREWRDRSRQFQAVAAMSSVNDETILTGRASRLPVEGRWVTGEFFSVLGVAPAFGRALRPDDDRPGAPAVVVISHRFWRDRLSASRDVVGQSLTLDGKPHTIVGVMPPGFAYPKGRACIGQRSRLPEEISSSKIATCSGWSASADCAVTPVSRPREPS